MGVLHNSEKEQFRKLFKRDKIDKFEERFSILNIFLQTERHLTFSEFLTLLSDMNLRVDSKLVSDTLKLMCRYGFARKHRFKSGEIRYEHMHLGQYHDHMICIKCKEIFEFKDKRFDQLQFEIASIQGFHVLQHHIELYGICSECMMEHRNVSSISDSIQGEKLIIVGFTGGEKAISRLSSFGLRIGDEVEIIANASKGQLVIALGHRRLILCREFAKKILVNVKINKD